MADCDAHLKELILAIMSEREKALTLTAKNLEYRLEHLNELREQVVEDRGKFLRKDVYEESNEILKRRVLALENNFSKLIGIAIALIAVSGILGGVIGHYVK